jgi:hypothetical protein
VNSAFGFAFWVMAAPLFPTDVVGLTAAIIAASTIVALLASLGVGSTLTQSLPEQGLSADWWDRSACMPIGMLWRCPSSWTAEALHEPDQRARCACGR